jgi:hypothetical protein
MRAIAVLPATLFTVIVGLASMGCATDTETRTDAGGSSISSRPASPASPADSSALDLPGDVINVDPADFATVNGDYEFLIAPELSCLIFAPSMEGLPLVVCRPIVFPPDSPVVNAHFAMSPNEIGINKDGIVPIAQLRGGPVLAQQMSAGSQIVVGQVRCTSLTDGVDCSTDVAGFRFENEQLTTRGPFANLPG